MDKIIIQESLAPLIAALTSNNNTGSNSGTDGGTDSGSGTDDNIDNNPPIMQSIITDKLESDGYFVHNPGTEDPADDVIIKPQDLNGYVLPTGRSYMGRPTYQVTIESPLENALKGYYDIGSLSNTIQDIIDAKALVSVYNSYTLYLYTNDDSLTINAQVNPVSYISDRINYLSATASLTFELTRVRDNLPTEVTLNFEGTEMAQTNVSAIDLTNGEEFIIKNFRYTDSLEFVDTFNEPISVLAGIEPELIIGSNRINKALMNIDIHYDNSNYIQNHVQLLHSSVPTTFEENKLNNLIKGAYKVDALLLEYTKTPQSDV